MDFHQRLGRIYCWPGGYAMTVDLRPTGNVVRCCKGHETPGRAKNHGLARLVESMAQVADEDISAWSAEESA